MSDYTPQRDNQATRPLRWSRGGGPAPSASVQSTIHQMTDQLQTVIEAAERAAEAIRHDAEEQARRHLAEAQRKADRLTAERVGLISELTDDLIRHAANVRDHSEQMVRALEDAINSVTDKLEQPAMSDPLGAAARPLRCRSGTSRPGPRRTCPRRPARSARPWRLHRPRRHPAAPAAGIGSGARSAANDAAKPAEPTDRRPATDARRRRSRGRIRASGEPASRSPPSPAAQPRTPTCARRSRRAHLHGAACPVPGALDGLRSSRRFPAAGSRKRSTCRSPHPVRASRPSPRTPSFTPAASPPPARPARRSPTCCARSGE